MAPRLKEPEMREFFAWDKDSEMVATYVHLSGRDVDNSVLSIYSMKEAGKSQEPVMVKPCPRCQDPSDPASRFCKKCGLPLDESCNADKLEGLLVDFLNVIGESFPQVKERFRAIVQEKGATSLSR